MVGSGVSESGFVFTYPSELIAAAVLKYLWQMCSWTINDSLFASLKKSRFAFQRDPG